MAGRLGEMHTEMGLNIVGCVAVDGGAFQRVGEV